MSQETLGYKRFLNGNGLVPFSMFTMFSTPQTRDRVSWVFWVSLITRFYSSCCCWLKVSVTFHSRPSFLNCYCWSAITKYLIPSENIRFSLKWEWMTTDFTFVTIRKPARTIRAPWFTYVSCTGWYTLAPPFWVTRLPPQQVTVARPCYNFRRNTVYSQSLNHLI